MYLLCGAVHSIFQNENCCQEWDGLSSQCRAGRTARHPWAVVEGLQRESSVSAQVFWPPLWSLVCWCVLHLYRYQTGFVRPYQLWRKMRVVSIVSGLFLIRGFIRCHPSRRIVLPFIIIAVILDISRLLSSRHDTLLQMPSVIEVSLNFPYKNLSYNLFRKIILFILTYEIWTIFYMESILFTQTVF